MKSNEKHNTKHKQKKIDAKKKKLFEAEKNWS